MSSVSHESSWSTQVMPRKAKGSDLSRKTRARRLQEKRLNAQLEPDEVDADAGEFSNELNLLSGVPVVYPGQENEKRELPEEGEEGLGNISEETLVLGELARLSINNEAEAAYDLPSTKETLHKTWNAKYTLRSHFDGVRALAFHPVEPVLVTASEDHTLKLWNLQKTVPAKKSASLDVEPLYTFRRHTGPVLCLSMSASGEQCFSGATDAATTIKLSVK